MPPHLAFHTHSRDPKEPEFPSLPAQPAFCLQSCLPVLPPEFLKQGLSLNLEFTDSLASDHLESSHLCLQQECSQVHEALLGFYGFTH